MGYLIQLTVSTMNNAQRVPWVTFPEVHIHWDEKKVKFHSHYQEAKQGSASAALLLIDDTFNARSIEILARWKRNSTPILVSVHAEEEMGLNVIMKDLPPPLS